MFPLVLAGTFLDTLYYRLNTVYQPLSDSPTVEVGADSPVQRVFRNKVALRTTRGAIVGR